MKIKNETRRTLQGKSERTNPKYLKNISKILKVPLTDFTQHIKE